MTRSTPSAKSPAGAPAEGPHQTVRQDPLVHLAYNAQKGQYQADVHWPGDPSARKRILLATADPAAAQLAYEAFQRNVLPALIAEYRLRKTAPDDPLNPTVDDFWTSFDAWAVHHFAPRTLDNLHTTWRWFTGLTGAQRLSDFTRPRIELFKRERLRLGKAPQTVNNNLRELQAVLNHGIREEFYLGPLGNPFTTIARYKVVRPIPRFHTAVELCRLLEAARRLNPDLTRTVLLCGWAGLRYGEAVNARWEWFTWTGPHPSLHVQPGPHFTPKDYEHRLIPIADRLRDELHALRQPEGYIIAPQIPARPNVPRLEMRKTMSAALRAAFLPLERPFQTLRDTFASLLVEQGTDIYLVSRWLGHSTVKTTERYYVAARTYSTDINKIDAKKKNRPRAAAKSRKGVKLL